MPESIPVHLFVTNCANFPTTWLYVDKASEAGLLGFGVDDVIDAGLTVTQISKLEFRAMKLDFNNVTIILYELLRIEHRRAESLTTTCVVQQRKIEKKQ